ncbi:isoprenyl transferase [bacterium]|nr:isoprenyl transferase [bacterium]
MGIPQHLGIIIDGNRRWAKKRNLPTFFGHKKGLDNLRKISSYAFKKGVRYLTIFAFSTENWKRDKKEVDYLMRLLKNAFSKKYIEELTENEVKVNFIGQIKRLPKELQQKIKEVENITKRNKKHVFNIALSYGGRADIVEAVKKIVKKRIDVKEIDEELFSKFLWTRGMPDPDLVIRTGDEKRVSNFLIWQMAYSELYFSKKFWPEFSKKDLDNAFLDYTRRQRRFGK